MRMSSWQRAMAIGTQRTSCSVFTAKLPLSVACRALTNRISRRWKSLLSQFDLHLIIHNLAIVNRQTSAGWALGYSSIHKRELRGMPWTLDCAFHDFALVERCTVMRANGT